MILVPSAMEQAIRILEERLASEERSKAEAHCRQFEGNEDEYGRDIVEIELSE